MLKDGPVVAALPQSHAACRRGNKVKRTLQIHTWIRSKLVVYWSRKELNTLLLTVL